MIANISVEKLMTTKVKTVNPLDVMTVVSDIFAKNNFNHLPVINEEDQLVGMISRKDFNKILTTFSIFKTARSEAENKKVQQSLLVKDVMTKRVVSLHPNDRISKAFDIFRKNSIHALPVINRDNQVVGMLTTFDLLNYAFENLDNS